MKSPGDRKSPFKDVISNSKSAQTSLSVQFLASDAQNRSNISPYRQEVLKRQLFSDVDDKNVYLDKCLELAKDSVGFVRSNFPEKAPKIMYDPTPSYLLNHVVDINTAKKHLSAAKMKAVRELSRSKSIGSHLSEGLPDSLKLVVSAMDDILSPSTHLDENKALSSKCFVPRCATKEHKIWPISTAVATKLQKLARSVNSSSIPYDSSKKNARSSLQNSLPSLPHLPDHTVSFPSHLCNSKLMNEEDHTHLKHPIIGAIKGQQNEANTSAIINAELDWSTNPIQALVKSGIAKTLKEKDIGPLPRLVSKHNFCHKHHHDVDALHAWTKGELKSQIDSISQTFEYKFAKSSDDISALQPHASHITVLFSAAFEALAGIASHHCKALSELIATLWSLNVSFLNDTFTTFAKVATLTGGKLIQREEEIESLSALAGIERKKATESHLQYLEESFSKLQTNVDLSMLQRSLEIARRENAVLESRLRRVEMTASQLFLQAMSMDTKHKADAKGITKKLKSTKIQLSLLKGRLKKLIRKGNPVLPSVLEEIRTSITSKKQDVQVKTNDSAGDSDDFSTDESTAWNSDFDSSDFDSEQGFWDDDDKDYSESGDSNIEQLSESNEDNNNDEKMSRRRRRSRRSNSLGGSNLLTSMTEGDAAISLKSLKEVAQISKRNESLKRVSPTDNMSMKRRTTSESKFLKGENGTSSKRNSLLMTSQRIEGNLQNTASQPDDQLPSSAVSTNQKNCESGDEDQQIITSPNITFDLTGDDGNKPSTPVKKTSSERRKSRKRALRQKEKIESFSDGLDGVKDDSVNEANLNEKSAGKKENSSSYVKTVGNLTNIVAAMDAEEKKTDNALQKLGAAAHKMDSFISVFKKFREAHHSRSFSTREVQTEMSFVESFDGASRSADACDDDEVRLWSDDEGEFTEGLKKASKDLKFALKAPYYLSQKSGVSLSSTLGQTNAYLPEKNRLLALCKSLLAYHEAKDSLHRPLSFTNAFPKWLEARSLERKRSEGFSLATLGKDLRPAAFLEIINGLRAYWSTSATARFIGQCLGLLAKQSTPLPLDLIRFFETASAICDMQLTKRAYFRRLVHERQMQAEKAKKSEEFFGDNYSTNFEKKPQSPPVNYASSSMNKRTTYVYTPGEISDPSLDSAIRKSKLRKKLTSDVKLNLYKLYRWHVVANSEALATRTAALAIGTSGDASNTSQVGSVAKTFLSSFVEKKGDVINPNGKHVKLLESVAHNKQASHRHGLNSLSPIKVQAALLQNMTNGPTGFAPGLTQASLDRMAIRSEDAWQIIRVLFRDLPKYMLVEVALSIIRGSRQDADSHIRPIFDVFSDDINNFNNEYDLQPESESKTVSSPKNKNSDQNEQLRRTLNTSFTHNERKDKMTFLLETDLFLERLLWMKNKRQVETEIEYSKVYASAVGCTIDEIFSHGMTIGNFRHALRKAVICPVPSPDSARSDPVGLWSCRARIYCQGQTIADEEEFMGLWREAIFMRTELLSKTRDVLQKHGGIVNVKEGWSVIQSTLGPVDTPLDCGASFSRGLLCRGPSGVVGWRCSQVKGLKSGPRFDRDVINSCQHLTFENGGYEQNATGITSDAALAVVAEDDEERGGDRSDVMFMMQKKIPFLVFLALCRQEGIFFNEELRREVAFQKISAHVLGWSYRLLKKRKEDFLKRIEEKAIQSAAEEMAIEAEKKSRGVSRARIPTKGSSQLQQDLLELNSQSNNLNSSLNK